MKSIYLQIIRLEDNLVVRSKDVTDKSSKSTNHLKNKWRAEFKDSYWQFHTIKIIGTELKQKIVTEQDNEVKERIGNIIELNNFYH